MLGGAGQKTLISLRLFSKEILDNQQNICSNSEYMTRPHPEYDFSNTDDQVAFVRKIKGTPSAVFLYLLFTKRALTQRQLCRIIDCSDRPIKRAVGILQREGVIQRSPSGWQLTQPYRKICLALSRGSLEQSALPENESSGLYQYDRQNRHELRGASIAHNGQSTYIPQSHHQIQANGVGSPSKIQGETLATKPKPENQVLGDFFRRIGVRAPNYQRFMNRMELQAEPAMAMAWYLFYKTESWVRNPVGLMLGSLADNLDPPAAFLALVRGWSRITPADRRQLQEMAWQMTPPHLMRQRFAADYPRLTAHVFAAFLKVQR